MKHIQLFEQFVFEASNKKRIKEIEKEMKEIDQRMEEIQDAMDNGDMDEDEAQIQLSDLDGNKLDLEAELADLKGEENEALKGEMIKLLSKLVGATAFGYQSSRWSVQLKYAPADKKKSLEYLKRRDEEIEAQEEAVVQKLIAKGEAVKDKMSTEISALFNFVKTDWIGIRKAKSKAAYAVQGIEEACKEFKKGCEEVAKRQADLKEIAPEYQKADAKLKELAKAASVRI